MFDAARDRLPRREIGTLDGESRETRLDWSHFYKSGLIFIVHRSNESTFDNLDPFVPTTNRRDRAV
jgi:hypothetical protein